MPIACEYSQRTIGRGSSSRSACASIASSDGYIGQTTSETPRAAVEAADDDEVALFADDQRAVFTAVVDARHAVRPGAEVALAVDHAQLHFFDPATGLALEDVRVAAPA